MGIVSALLMILGEFVPANPSYEITLGRTDEHDGIWDAVRTEEGSFICCGYSGNGLWVGSLSPEMELEWQLDPGSGSPSEEAVAICSYLDGYAVAVNSGVPSPGARHQLLEAVDSWILLLDEEGRTIDSLGYREDPGRVLMDIVPGPGGTLACCGITFGNDRPCAGAFWLLDSGGSILMTTDFGSDSISSLDCIEPIPGGGYILGGSSSVSPSFTVVRVDSSGELEWISRSGHQRTGIHARDILLTGNGSCMAAGGGLWSDPLAVELDTESGSLSGIPMDEGWFTIFGLDGSTGRVLYIGHNMLCDGADSETYVSEIGSNDQAFPLRITGRGACRCRTFIPSGDTLYIFGEVSEYWDGHQDIWASATVGSDWILEEDGSRLNADFR
jgi:hypothetical protein